MLGGRFIGAVSCVFLCSFTLAFPARGALPPEAVPLLDAFESSLSGFDGELAGQLKQLAQSYEAALRKLRADLEVAGQMRPLIAVHDEIARFQKSRDPAPPSPESVELSTLQAAYLLRVQQVTYSNDVEVVRLSERYVQALAELREGLARAAARDAVKALDLERDRLLSLARLRNALGTTASEPPAPSPSTQAADDPAAGGADAPKSRSLRLYRLSSEDVSRIMGFSMDLVLLEDASRLKVRESRTATSLARSEDGAVAYTPRVTIVSRNTELPPDSVMTIEYYSRSFTESGYRKESSETLALPRLPKGESTTLQGRGVSLWRSLSTTHTGRAPDAKSHAGSELYGMVISVRDAQRNLLLLRFTPQSLSREIEGREP